MADFKVGDRVRVFGIIKSLAAGEVIGCVGEHNDMFVVDANASPEYVRVQCDSGVKYLAHPKQCRRLVKKQRRRVCIRYGPDGEWAWLFKNQQEAVLSLEQYPGSKIAEFLEVWPK